MNNIKKLSSNMEDYLEAISFLKSDNKVARVRDISAMLKVKNPSVIAALSTLSKNGYIIHERYGYIDLTQKGQKKADDIKKKHAILFEFLQRVLKLDKDTAKEDACKMEHAISPATYQKLAKFVGKYDK
ncbi:metal-dependent transcriptional regulator [Elusimicrobiota bacterium]